MRRAAMLIMVLLLCGSVWANGQTPDVVRKMGLKKISVEGATVYYEPCLETKLEVFKKAYADYRERMAERLAPGSISREELVDKKTIIVDDIYNIIGGDDKQLKEKLLDVADGFNNLSGTVVMPLTGDDNVVYLMLQSTTKEYLRGGGTLPNLTYDKETDTAEYIMPFSSGANVSLNREILFPLASANEIESVLNTVFTSIPELFDQSFGKNGFVVIHEVAEVGIMERLRTQDPYKRWFTDGFSNAITCEILQRHYSPEDVKEFLETYSTAPYQNLKSSCNLRYWFSRNFSMSNHPPIKQEDELTYARYCFATEQGLRMVKAYGIECIKKILDQYVANGEKKPGAILTAIEQATGDEIKKHLSAYQSFSTKKEGLKLYHQAVNTAMTEKNYSAAAFAILRILELRGDQPYSPVSLNTRISLAELLYHNGHDQASTKWITEFADLMCLSKNPDKQYVGRRFVIMYAIKTGQPQIGLEYARAILQNKPEDTHGLMIVMLNEANQKNVSKAVELAKKICKIEPNEDDPCHAVAKSVLDKFNR